MHKIVFNSGWLLGGKPVTLPHDAQITEKRGADVSNGGHGYFPGGIYTYEKPSPLRKSGKKRMSSSSSRAYTKTQRSA